MGEDRSALCGQARACACFVNPIRSGVPVSLLKETNAPRLLRIISAQAITLRPGEIHANRIRAQLATVPVAAALLELKVARP